MLVHAEPTYNYAWYNESTAGADAPVEAVPKLKATYIISRCQGYSCVIKVIQFLPVYIIIRSCLP